MAVKTLIISLYQLIFINGIKQLLHSLAYFIALCAQKLVFCLNSGESSDKLIDDNTLTFVALHELSHIGTAEVGHTPTYWQNFKFILENAVEAGIYKPVDYKKKPKGYCGMTITDNPYYDL